MYFIRTVASANASSSQEPKINTFWYNYCCYNQLCYDLWQETEFVRFLLTSFDHHQQAPPPIIVGVSCSFELVTVSQETSISLHLQLYHYIYSPMSFPLLHLHQIVPRPSSLERVDWMHECMNARLHIIIQKDKIIHA